MNVIHFLFSKTIQCSVCKFAQNSAGKTRKMHKIPADRELANKWFSTFPQMKLNSKSRVCSEHFLDVDYENNCKFDNLKVDGEKNDVN
jgi:THAP domain